MSWGDLSLLVVNIDVTERVGEPQPFRSTIVHFYSLWCDKRSIKMDTKFDSGGKQKEALGLKSASYCTHTACNISISCLL